MLDDAFTSEFPSRIMLMRVYMFCLTSTNYKMKILIYDVLLSHKSNMLGEEEKKYAYSPYHKAQWVYKRNCNVNPCFDDIDLC